MLLNIGLAVSNGTAIHPAHALASARAIAGARPSRWAVHQSDTEPTLVIETAPVHDTGLYALAQHLKQDAVAAFDGREGRLIGPNAFAWGGFDPSFFLGLDGSRLGSAAAAA